MMISNGLAWSPDGRTMYHADTPTQHRARVRLRRAHGYAVAKAKRSCTWSAEGDRPDGACVDSEGCYWSAFYRGGKVVRVSPEGRMLGRVSAARDVPDDVRARRA